VILVRSSIASYHSRTISVSVSTVIVILASLALVFIQACEEKVGTENAKSITANGLHKKIEKDSVSVTIDTDKKEMTVSEHLSLTVSGFSNEDWEIVLPSIDEKFGQFVIVDYHTTRPQLTDQKRKKISRSYLLEPFLSGDYIIPPVTVKFKKEEEVLGVETPEIIIKVKSLLPKGKSDFKIHDIKPPMELPLSIPVGWLAALFGFLVIITLLSLYVLKRRKRKTLEEIQIDPGEIALEELETLASEKLEEKGATKRLYHEISNILRRYIERCFGIRAPEQTTEEFLTGLENSGGFPEKYNRLLKTFLRYCDLVKFAEHQPERDDIQNAFESCREFINGTRAKER